ncbi:reverse transcriptase domain-containing protein [Tanacetum coccineum]
MPFGLCNAPATFQRCMLAIFHHMIEESVEIFMDDFSVFENSFDTCLNNLDKMLQRCKDAHLVLNWEKCHLMVKEGIVLGHKVSSAGLEVDKAKIDVISNSTLLISKDTPFEFDDECQRAFESLKQKLTCAPVIIHIKLLSKTIVHTDHSALRHLFKKQDANQTAYSLDFYFSGKEFNIEIKDRKGTKNIAADHLSRLENNETSDDSEVDDNFPGETLMEININEPWFTDFANYLVGSVKDGPSPGIGHGVEDNATLGGIKSGHSHVVEQWHALGGIKEGPSPGVGHKFVDVEPLGGLKDSVPSPGVGH